LWYFLQANSKIFFKKGDEMKTGIELIEEERKRQINKEGFTTSTDLINCPNGKLAEAASCYSTTSQTEETKADPPITWPWGKGWWKPKTKLRNLARAGALIAAEIDRIQAGQG